MANVIITSPAEYYPNPDIDRPLFSGSMFIGEPDTDPTIVANQKQVQALQENGSFVNVSQPIEISSGGVPVDGSGNPYIRLVADGNYSQLVKDKNGSQKYYIPNAFTGAPLTSTSDDVVLSADTVADLKTKDLQSGQTISTKGYYTKGDGGGASYLIQTAAEFGGTTDEKRNITLNNGNIAVSQIDSSDSIKSVGYTFGQKTEYAEPFGRFIFGLEYSYALTKALFDNTPTAYTTFVHSGDSTTAGDNLEGFTPSAVMSRYAENMGLATTQINAGHSGESSIDWNNTWVDQDIINYPNMDAYFVRWGINDGSLHGNPDTFETNIRAGLTKLRAFKDSGSLTIVLMMPNSVNDTPNGRDAEWMESIHFRLRQAARDFECVFYDTYGIYRDSINGAGKWLDDPFADGRGIHPSKELGTLIYKPLADALLGTSAGLRKNTNRFSNISSIFQITQGEPAANYHQGKSIFRAQPVDGWALDGAVLTEKSADNVLLQTLVEFRGTSEQRVFQRVGNNADGFSSWRQYGKVDLNYETGWDTAASQEPMRASMSGQLVTLTGMVQYIPRNPADGLVIAILPSDLRPQFSIQYVCKTQTGATFGECIISVLPSGNVTITNGGDGVSIGLNCSFVASSML